MALTSDEARALRDEVLKAANGIDEYLDRNWNTISRPQYEILNEQQKSLLRVATFLTTEAVGLAIQEMENPSVALVAVIDQAKKAIAKTENFRTALRIATALVELGGAIINRDAGDAFNAAKKVADEADVDWGALVKL